MNNNDDQQKTREIIDGLNSVREKARKEPIDKTTHKVSEPETKTDTPLENLIAPQQISDAKSPDRQELNTIWNLQQHITGKNHGFLATLFLPIKTLLRIGHNALIDQQTQVNSAQVRFNNEIVEYLDTRLDRVSEHYDQVLGLHGKRMEEIDERHLILQQELIRHVHDLVERIEFVFESAESNHLYTEGVLREAKEEIGELKSKVEELVRTSQDKA